jgi:hypothetical protein
MLNPTVDSNSYNPMNSVPASGDCGKRLWPVGEVSTPHGIARCEFTHRSNCIGR